MILLKSIIFFVLHCVLNSRKIHSSCITTKYEAVSGTWLKCSDINWHTLENQNPIGISAIMILNSNLTKIPSNTFLKYGNSLTALNINNCSLNFIDNAAFHGLWKLTKLSLSSNNLQHVKSEWFTEISALEQLDLSFNNITHIDNQTFFYIKKLKRLDVSDNSLQCLTINQLTPLNALYKLKLINNPMTFTCHGQLTLWLKDRGVNYLNYREEQGSWLEHLLWQCMVEDIDISNEIVIKECVILKMFNQLRMALINTDYYPIKVTHNVVNLRNLFIDCLKNSNKEKLQLSNGNIIKQLLLYLHNFKHTI